ncbi:MAG: hypothetical protein ABI763_05900 [Bacteroidota bacterium]
MKNQILLLVTLAAMMFNSYATVRTVSNDPAGGAQYADLQSAYLASAATDTLMLEGTNIAYTVSNAINWSKQLVVIGIGFNPAKFNPRQTLINGLGNTTIVLNSVGNGSKFYGIRFTAASLALNSTISNYTFEDCMFDNTLNFIGQSNLSGITFRNCIFLLNGVNYIAGATSNPYSNIVFLSCVFNGYIDGSGNTNSGVTVDHCIFLSTNNALNNLQNSVIRNSIFMNVANITPTGSINNTFTNNISRLATTYPPSGNMGSGNFTSTNPNFVTYTLNAAYSASHDYHLNPTPSVLYVGTDATDIGLHGGIAHFSETGEVLINPIVRNVQIGNTSLAPNGNLNVTISAGKPNDQ